MTDLPVPPEAPSDSAVPLAAESGNPVGAAAERRLDPRVVHVWRVGILIRSLFWAGAVLALTMAVPLAATWRALVIVPILLGIGFALLWPAAQYRRWGFCTRERDLFIRSGVYWRRLSIIPYSRIQHVDTRSGPLERWLGLARLVVYTAGVRGADVTIPGLPAGEAETLREQLAAVGGSEDAV